MADARPRTETNPRRMTQAEGVKANAGMQGMIGGPRTEYVLVEPESKPRSLGSRLGTARGYAPTPGIVPRFLGSRRIIATTWVISMVIVGFDDWHNNGVLPRPARLWYTSLFYGLLALASIADGLLPLINAIAIGYTITLLWQYFNGQGQFGE